MIWKRRDVKKKKNFNCVIAIDETQIGARHKVGQPDVKKMQERCNIENL